MENIEFEFFTNMEKDKLEHHKICKQLSGLVCFENEKSYDAYGNLMEDHISVYTPNYLEQNEAKKKYFRASTILRRLYRQKMLECGVSERALACNHIYLGCERIYYPEHVHRIHVNVNELIAKARIELGETYG